MSVLVEAVPEPQVTWFRETTVVEASSRISIRTEKGSSAESYLLVCDISVSSVIRILSLSLSNTYLDPYLVVYDTSARDTNGD